MPRAARRLSDDCERVVARHLVSLQPSDSFFPLSFLHIYLFELDNQVSEMSQSASTIRHSCDGSIVSCEVLRGQVILQGNQSGKRNLADNQQRYVECLTTFRRLTSNEYALTAAEVVKQCQADARLTCLEIGPGPTSFMSGVNSCIISSCTLFESNAVHAKTLQETLPPGKEWIVHEELFPPKKEGILTTMFAVVLLIHSAYGMKDKTEFVKEALR